ncbi:MAG: CBS domain-containing protein [Mariprofundaceae bacterium]
MKITSKIERMVAIVDEHVSALEAAELMTGKYIGSVVVTSNSGIKGLFTERDLMMRVVGERRDPAATKVKDVMPDDVVKVRPDEQSERCLDLMKAHRCRHLMVFDGDEFVGIVSLRDIVTLMNDEKEDLIARLKEYITS